MRRPRRHRWLTLSVFFITYSIFHAVLSATVDKTDVSPAPGATTRRDGEGGTEPETAVSPSDGDNPEKPSSPEVPEGEGEPREGGDGRPREGDEGGKKALKTRGEEEGEKKKQKDAGYQDNEEMIDTRVKEEIEDAEEEYPPTVHPLRNCTPPAIEQFPRPLMGQSARRHGGLIIHILVCVYTFIGLAIVCDEYFVSSLDRICEEFKLAPDVAGATFMAAGSSAPELATVIIGVFCAQDDIGVSGVIGSAVFNIMFVISVCALCAGTVSHLNWWPLCRDCFFYAISILVMLCTICNGYVSWPESLFMLCMYGVYCVALRFNSTLEAWAMTIPLPFKLPTREEQAALVTYKSAGGQPPAAAAGDEYTQVEGQTKETTLQNPPYNPQGAYDNAAYNADPNQTWDPSQEWNPDAAWGSQQQQPPAVAPASGWGATDSWGAGAPAPPAAEQSPPTPAQAAAPVAPPSTSGWGAADSWGAGAPAPTPAAEQSPPTPAQAAAPVAPPAAPTYYKAKEYNPETAVNPLVKPVGANPVQLACFYVAYPIHWSCRHTMPDCRGRWYPVTFIVSMLWISFFSYFMVWMITIIGYTLGIPDTVMGLTFVAAGVSVPDALSSLAVIKEGYGDMAVSNAVGSNVFDILVCLGLPWFIQTAIIQPGSHVNVISKGLIYSTLSLFSTVIFLVVATHANGWKLDRKYGAVLMVWYLLFITFASLYELNVFGDFHPPDCLSAY